MKICNIFFKYKNKYMYTWERLSLSQKSIIDYIMRQKTAFEI